MIGANAVFDGLLDVAGYSASIEPIAVVERRDSTARVSLSLKAVADGTMGFEQTFAAVMRKGPQRKIALHGVGIHAQQAALEPGRIQQYHGDQAGRGSQEEGNAHQGRIYCFECA